MKMRKNKDPVFVVVAVRTITMKHERQSLLRLTIQVPQQILRRKDSNGAILIIIVAFGFDQVGLVTSRTQEDEMIIERRPSSMFNILQLEMIERRSQRPDG
jgi:hypothetical protein